MFISLGRIHEAWLTRNFLFRSLALRGLVGAILGSIIGITLAVKGFGVYALVYQQISTSVFSLIAMWIVVKWRPTFVFSRRVASSLVSLLKTTTPNSLMWAISQTFDIALVTYYFGVETTGFYSLAKRVKLALQLVATTPVNGVSLPSVASAQADPERLRRVFFKGLMIISASSLPVFVGAAATAPELIRCAFGFKWLPASPVLLTMTLAAGPAVLMNWYDTFFLVKNRPRWSLLASTLMLLLSVASFYIVPNTNPAFAAVPFALPLLLVFPISTFAVSSLLNVAIKNVIGAIGPCLISSMIMFAVVESLRQLIAVPAALNLFLATLVGGATYFLSLALTGRKHLSLMLSIGRDILSRALPKRWDLKSSQGRRASN